MSSAAKKATSQVSELKELLSHLPALESFPPHMVAQLERASELITFPVNTQILKQGQMNEHLYFLINGLVGIYVDGARVSKLQRKGDLLGEMSVISNKPANATILSETEVTLIRVDSRLFLDMKGPERELYLSILYRIYATVLAEKLEATNEKAKHFEGLTIQLSATQEELKEINQNLEKKVEERTQKLEQQNMEIMAAKNKMEDLLNTKRVVFNKLSDLHDHHLKPLKALLDDLRKVRLDDPIIDQSRNALFDMLHLIGPIADQYSSEQAVHSKRLLLADSNKKQQVAAKLALGGTGVILDIVGSIEEGRAKLEEQSYDLVVFDVPMLELGNVAKEKNPKTGIVLMTSDQVPTYLPALKQLSEAPNIVSRDDEDRTFTIKNVVTTVTKILSRDYFGLEKYLSWGIDIQTRPIVSSKKRAELIQDVDSHFERLGVRRANRDRVRTVLEEMLMNAIYDAPIDKDGKSLYNHLPRSVELALKPEEQGVLRFATDGMLIAVSVQDPFGSLKGSTLLKYLESNYAGEAAGLNEKENKGGAGRGLHQIVECSDLVVFNVEPGKKTEVIALFHVDVKKRVQQNPSFHLFWKT